MAVDVLLGLQWGDEGKGKIVDVIAPNYDIVARFQGGPNAGHTLEFNGIKQVLHQVPSGIFHEKIKNVIGNGVVLDVVTFINKEIKELSEKGIDATKNLYISKKAQLILPTHRLLDKAYELSKGDAKIGSTQKGIGPTYSDKIARKGLRVGDLLSRDFKSKYNKLVDEHKAILEQYKFDYTSGADSLQPLEDAFFTAAEAARKFKLIESEYFINDALSQGASVLAEGAQGSLLDIDFGSYPFVTSSNTMTAGACTGLGIAPSHIKEVFGIFKAYCTRVGSGPFPTELFDKDGDEIRARGREYGSTTGRPRRCGWIDIPALNYAIMLNGVTQLLMMKADVLDAFEDIKVCTQYKHEDGQLSAVVPYDLCTERVSPYYEVLNGWKQDISRCNDFDSIPPALAEYVVYLEKLLNRPINLVSTGPDRDQTLIKSGKLNFA
ncbi:MAG TPA: adenylosuccinate synthase [Cytophagales bacterium]|nr:adenylosuccinate synthase [Cytophagales bacterium]